MLYAWASNLQTFDHHHHDSSFLLTLITFTYPAFLPPYMPVLIFETLEQYIDDLEQDELLMSSSASNKQDVAKSGEISDLTNLAKRR